MPRGRAERTIRSDPSQPAACYTMGRLTGKTSYRKNRCGNRHTASIAGVKRSQKKGRTELAGRRTATPLSLCDVGQKGHESCALYRPRDGVLAGSGAAALAAAEELALAAGEL